MQYLDTVSKTRVISVCFQGKPFNIMVIQVYAPKSNTEEAEVEWFLWRPTRPFRTNTPKTCPFHYRGVKCKSRKSRNTWNNGQIWFWSAEWSRANANRVLPEECTGHSKHPLTTTQEKTLHMDITRWPTTKSEWLYFLQPRWRSSVQSAKIWLGADCDSDHELLIAKSLGKCKLKLQKH